MYLTKNSVEFLLSFSLISLVNNAEIKEPALNLDPPLRDIVINITKVNTLLQDLIKNYEKLKKMSQPESIGDTYEDTVIHELFNDNDDTKMKKPTTPDAITVRIQGTAMEVSYEEKYNSASPKPTINRHNKNEEKIKKDNSKKNVAKSGEETISKKENYREVIYKESTAETELPAKLRAIAKKFFSDRLSESEETTTKSSPSTTTKNTDRIIKTGNFTDLESRIRQRTGLFKNNGQKETHPIYIQQSSKALVQVASVPMYKKKLEPAKESDIDATTIEETKAIQNEEIKTNVLREAYGDACLKLVVRKCYMACKYVFKEVCRTNHKCSPEFKQSFKKHAITGCDSSFYNNSVGSGEKPITKQGNHVALQDMTREGYLSMACAPFSSRQAITQPPKPVRRQTDNQQKPRHVELLANGIIKPPVFRQNPRLRNRPNKTSTKIISLKPILRADKYELACQQASMMKCFKACKHAAVEACKTEKCSEKKKTALNKACKSHCKQVYGGKDSDDDSDSDESESESEKKEPEDEWR